jgi:prolyl 4-hydroxylase
MNFVQPNFYSMQDVEEDCPLTLIDLKFKKKKIFLKPGEMLLYESAKLPHGRQYPLKGKFFDNIFIHYK